jgi:hypothetical protein
MKRPSTSPSSNPIAAARPGACPAKDRRRCAGRCTRPRTPRGGRVRQTATTTCRRPSGWAATAPVWRSHASCLSAATTRCGNWATTHSQNPRPVADPRAAGQAAALAQRLGARQTTSVRMLWPLDPGFGSAMQQPVPAGRPAHNHATNLDRQANRSRASSPDSHDAPRPAPSLLLPTRSRVRPRKIERPQRFPQRDHPIEHLVADPGANPEPWTKVRPGARAQTRSPQRAHAPPSPRTVVDTPRRDK